MSIARQLSSLLTRATTRVVLIFAGAVLLPSIAHATAQYSAPVNISVSISYATNSAGLTDYRSATITASFSSTPNGSEGIYNGGTLYLYVGSNVYSVAIPGTPNPYLCSVSFSENLSFDPSSANTPVYAYCSFPFWNQGGSNSGDGTYTKYSTTLYTGPGTNTLGSASYSFSGGPWTYDTNSHSITISPSPSNAGWTQTGGNSSGTETNAGSYNITVGPSNPDYSGSGSYSWTINKANMNAPTAASPVSVVWGNSWSATYQAPLQAPPGGGYTFCVAGRTNWGDPSWTPGSGDAGQPFSYYVACYGSAANYNGTPDSHLPGMVLAMNGPYTINVLKRDLTPPNAPTDVTIPWNQTWTPSITGGTPISGVAMCIGAVTPWIRPPYGPPGVSQAGTAHQYWIANTAPASAYNGTPCTDPGFTDQVLAISGPAMVNVTKADQTITFPNPGNQLLNQAFTVNATASSGLSVTYTITAGSGTVSGNTITGTATGSLTIRADQPGNSQYNAAPSVSQTITISKASASISLGNLNQTYDGGQHAVSVSTSPGGLATTVTYNGSTTPPTNAGSYTVNATINDPNYQGSATATLTINAAGVSFSFSGGPHFTYDGNSHGVSVSATPSNATYNTANMSATGANAYTATASAYGNYSGSGSYNWWIDKADQSPVAVNPLSQTITARSNASFTATGGTAGAYIWGGSATGSGPTNSTYFGTAGTYSVNVYRAGDSNYNPSNTATATVTVNPYPATLSVTGTTAFASAYRDTLAGTPTSTTQTFTVTNTGDVTLSVTGASATGTFAVTSAPAWPVSLNAGQSTTITVTFTPGASVGANSGTLTVTSNANTSVLSLSGTGLAPTLNITWH